MVAWIILVLSVAVALMLGVERLLARLGVRRADPSAAPRGFHEVLARLRARR